MKRTWDGNARYSVRTPWTCPPKAVLIIAAVGGQWISPVTKFTHLWPTFQSLTSSPIAIISPALSEAGTRLGGALERRKYQTLALSDNLNAYTMGYEPFAMMRSRNCTGAWVHWLHRRGFRRRTWRDTAWIFTRTSLALSLRISASLITRFL